MPPTREELIDAHAEAALAEIRAFTARALREMKRRVEYPNRSAGQRRRHENRK
jgi:hypothetical protein